MFGSIQRIKRKGFNLQWSYGIEGKDIIFTIKAIPVGRIDRNNCLIIKANTAYMIVIAACTAGDNFASP